LKSIPNWHALNQMHFHIVILSNQSQFLRMLDLSMVLHFQMFRKFQSRLRQTIYILLSNHISFWFHRTRSWFDILAMNHTSSFLVTF
jgi:hypothetical protein